MFKTTQKHLHPTAYTTTLNTNVRSFGKLMLFTATSLCSLGYAGKYLTDYLGAIKNSNNDFEEMLGKDDNYKTSYAPIKTVSFNTGRMLLSNSNYRIANLYEYFQINSYALNKQSNPSIAGLSGEKFVETWMSIGQDGSYGGIYAKIFSNSGVALSEEFKVNNYTNDHQFSPCVSKLSNDGFVITWSSSGQDGSQSGIYAQTYNSDGNVVGKEFKVNTYIFGDQREPKVIGLHNGKFVIVWESNGQDGSDNGVYGQVFNNDGSVIGNEFRVNTYTNSYQMRPCIASFSNSNFVVAWASYGQDGSGTGIYAQIFDDNGIKVGREFRVNEEINGDQYNPDVTFLLNNKFVLAWHSSGKIFSKIYSISGDKLSSEFVASSLNYYYESPKIIGLSLMNNFVIINDFYFKTSSDSPYYYGGIAINLFDGDTGKIGEDMYLGTMPLGSSLFTYSFSKAITNSTNNHFLISWSDDAEVFSKLFGIFTSSPTLTISTTSSYSKTNSFSHTQTNTPTITFSSSSRLSSVSPSNSGSPRYSLSPKNSLSPPVSFSPVSPSGYVVKSESSNSPSPSPLAPSVKDYTSSACMNKPLLINFIKSTKTNTQELFNYARGIIDVWLDNAEENNDQTIINNFSKLKI